MDETIAPVVRCECGSVIQVVELVSTTYDFRVVRDKGEPTVECSGFIQATQQEDARYFCSDCGAEHSRDEVFRIAQGDEPCCHDGVSNMLDLSTAHMPSSDPDFGRVRHVRHEYGFVAYLGDGPRPHQGEDRPFPEWLRPIYLHAKANGCILIDFDRDAEVVDQFPTYEW